MPVEPGARDVARERIDHIVVLMLENRAFDHMLGFLDHPKLEKLEPGDCPNPLNPHDPASVGYGVTPDASYSLPVDAPHSHLSVMKQLNGTDPSAMNGFVAAYIEKAGGREPAPIVHWGRVEILVIVLAAVMSAVAWAVGSSWGAAAAVSLLLSAVVTSKLLRLRRVIPHWWRYLGIGLCASLAVGLLARVFGPHLSTAIGMGVLLALSGSLVVWCRHSRPPYAHPADPQQALNDAPEVMRCMPNERIPALGKLARGFAVCTAWHCSVPGPTWPNRNFAHAATSDGTTDIELGFYRNKTIFELLSKAGVPWRIYRDGMAQVMAFAKVWQDWGSNWFEVSEFEGHVRNGTLPAYSFIEPNHAGPTSNSQHPGNNLAPHADGVYDFQRGEALIAQVYETLKRHGDVFDRTVLLITYDEHGGLFDHVSPPANLPAPTRRKRMIDITRRFIALFVTYAGSRFAFNVLGPRVPAVVVSPWIDAGVCDETFEHASIVATVRSLFAPGARPLNRRDREANTFERLVTQRDHRRPSSELPDLAEELTPKPPAPVPRPTAARVRAGRLGGAEAAVPEKTDLAEELDRLARQVDKELAKAGAPEVPDADVAAAAVGGEIPPNQATVARFRRFCEQQRRAPTSR